MHLQVTTHKWKIASVHGILFFRLKCDQDQLQFYNLETTHLDYTCPTFMRINSVCSSDSCLLKTASIMAPPKANLTGFDIRKLAASTGTPANDPWARV